MREGPACKTTGLSTNSPCVTKQLSTRCPNWTGTMVHSHVRSENGRARKAQERPDKLRRAICRGVQEQIEVDNSPRLLLSTICAEHTGSHQSIKEDIKRQDNNNVYIYIYIYIHIYLLKRMTAKPLESHGAMHPERHWIPRQFRGPDGKRWNTSRK